jgi:threonyl-tRNA synthetase
VAYGISPGLAKAVLSAEVNGEVVDLSRPIHADASLKLLKWDDEGGKSTFWHSSAHLMAEAIETLFPGVKFWVGPPVEHGYYYDIDLGDRTMTEEDLGAIEKLMIELAKKDNKYERSEMSKSDAVQYFTEKGDEYKLDLLSGLEDGSITFYKQGNFTDLCRGPHIPSTGLIKAIKLLSVAGAYWKGDSNNKQLTRVYGITFPKQQQLDEYMHMLEEAKKRDHRILGKELEIFAFDDDVGPGLPLWLPKGAAIIEKLEELAKKNEREQGYVRVKTPHIAKESMYIRSGHLPYYADSMFPPMEMDGTKYYLKAMNCPHHHKIFAATPKSYRDLPVRLAEYGTCYRYEQSGELFGLMRVRSLQMNDAHIYCTESQFEEEFMKVNELYVKYFKIFGIEKYVMRFSKHDPAKLGQKYIDNALLWQKTEDMVRKVLVKSGMPFKEVEDEAAFYGPKIDIQIWSAIGREFTIATNQVDFAQAERFDLSFINDKNERERPLIIHRAPLSTHERFIGFLLEHYAGKFPVWLSPEQVAILPISGEICRLRQANPPNTSRTQHRSHTRRTPRKDWQKNPRH